MESGAINDITATNNGHVILIAIFQSLSSVYSGIFEVIIRYRVNRKNKTNQTDIKIRNNITNPSLFLTILLYIIISSLDAITNFLFVYRVFLIKEVPNPPYIENKGILIFASCLCCYFILGYKLERYQFFALGIIIIAFIFNGTMSVFNVDSFSTTILEIEFIVCIGYNCYRIKINQDNTPTHRVIADSFYSLVMHIIQMLTNKVSLSSFGYLIGYCTVVFGCCVYNEIIIVNFCNLNSNTEREVTKRAISESSVEIYDDILAEGEINVIRRDSLV